MIVHRLVPIILSFLIVFVLLLIVSCSSDDTSANSLSPNLPTVTTSPVTGETQTTAECGGTATSDGGSPITARGVCWSTNPSPIVADHRSNDGMGTGSFASSLTDLSAGTPYYVRAYASNRVGTGFGSAHSFRTSSASGTVTDIDGNVYQAVTIGTQVWMAGNLRVTHFRNGDPIPDVADSSTWSGLSTGAHCAYDDDESYVSVYGLLYNWYAVDDSRSMALDGWHVPSYAEWVTLVNYLGGESVAGGKLKQTGTTHWGSPNAGATNESGFSALPGGKRNYLGTSHGMGYYAFFWTSSKNPPGGAFSQNLAFHGPEITLTAYGERAGYSVRCVKD